MTATATATEADRPIRRAALTAGAGLLVMSGLAAFGNLVVLEGIVEPGNAARTAAAVADSAGTFRLAVVSLFVVIALDVVVAWALYRVLSPVDQALSLLAAWLRLAFAAVFLVAVGGLVGVPRLLDGDHLAAFSTAQRQALALEQINSFHDHWAAGLFLFGLHLLAVGHLVYRSHAAPRFLGLLIALAGLGYVTDSLGATLVGESWNDISVYTFIGEFLLALWLVTRGRRLAGAQVADRKAVAAPRP